MISPFEKNENQKTTPIKLRDRIKTLAIEWIKSSTIHALPKVFHSQQIYLKVIWLLLFLASFTACSYISINYFITFFSYNTNVNFAIVTESPTNFPSITICNINPFYNKRSSNYIKNVLNDNNLLYLANLTSMNQNESAIQLLNSAQTVIKTYVATYKNLTIAERKLLGWDIDEMLLSCYFNGNKCSSTDFTWFFNYDYGNCYTLNSGLDSYGNASSLKQINNAGSGSALQIELFVGDDSSDSVFISTSGAYIVVHNQSVTPLLESEGIHAATNFETNIAIERIFKTNLPYPYSSCLKNNTSPESSDSALYKAIFNTLNQKTYRQKYCYRLCYQQSVILDCNCSDSSLPNPFPTKNGVTISNCIVTSQLSCLSVSKAKFQSSSINEKCSSDCPLECSSVSYDAAVTLATYPTSFYSSWLQLQSNLLQKFQNNQTTTAKIQSSVVKLNIFYNSMTYTSITDTATITWDSLLGSIGGHIGLFLGMSVLTFCEVIEIICEMVRIFWTHKNRLKEIQEVNSK
jgi:hypothetical protein